MSQIKYLKIMLVTLTIAFVVGACGGGGGGTATTVTGLSTADNTQLLNE